MEQKIYKYKDLEFKSVKRTLEFYATKTQIIKEITDNIVQDGIFDQNKFIIWLHKKDSINLILNNLVEGDTSSISLDGELTDEEYNNIMTLVSEIITDFFLNMTPIKKQLKQSKTVSTLPGKMTEKKHQKISK